jgi:hypothetical protein
MRHLWRSPGRAPRRRYLPGLLGDVAAPAATDLPGMWASDARVHRPARTGGGPMWGVHHPPPGTGPRRLGGGVPRDRKTTAPGREVRGPARAAPTDGGQNGSPGPDHRPRHRRGVCRARPEPRRDLGATGAQPGRGPVADHRPTPRTAGGHRRDSKTARPNRADPPPRSRTAGEPCGRCLRGGPTSGPGAKSSSGGRRPHDGSDRRCLRRRPPSGGRKSGRGRHVGANAPPAAGSRPGRSVEPTGRAV